MSQKIALDISRFNDLSIEITEAEVNSDGILGISFHLCHNNESIHGWGRLVNSWELQFELEELEDESGSDLTSEKFFCFTAGIGVHPYSVAEAIIHKLADIQFFIPSPNTRQDKTHIMTSYRYLDQTIHIPISSVSQLVTVLEQ